MLFMLIELNLIRAEKTDTCNKIVAILIELNPIRAEKTNACIKVVAILIELNLIRVEITWKKPLPVIGL